MCKENLKNKLHYQKKKLTLTVEENKHFDIDEEEKKLPGERK